MLNEEMKPLEKYYVVFMFGTTELRSAGTSFDVTLEKAYEERDKLQVLIPYQQIRYAVRMTQ